MATLKSVKKQVFNLWRKLLPSLHKVDFVLYHFLFVQNTKVLWISCIVLFV